MLTTAPTANRIRVLVPSIFVRLPAVKQAPLMPGSVTPDVLRRYEAGQDQYPQLMDPFLIPDEVALRPDGMLPASEGGAAEKLKTDWEALCLWGSDPHNPIPCRVDVAKLKKFAEVAAANGSGAAAGSQGIARTIRAVADVMATPAEINPSGKSGADALQEARSQVAEAVVQSLQAPFSLEGRRETVDLGSSSSVNPDPKVRDAIVWSLDKMPRRDLFDSSLGGRGGAGVVGGTGNARQQRMIHNSDPWSIVAYCAGGDGSNVFLRKNIVYDGEGLAVAQVDFGHGTWCGTHAHALVENSLEHASSLRDDHAFQLFDVPWMWLCLPLSSAVIQTTPFESQEGGRFSADWWRDADKVYSLQGQKSGAPSKGSKKKKGDDEATNLSPYEPDEPNDVLSGGTSFSCLQRHLRYQLPRTVDHRRKVIVDQEAYSLAKKAGKSNDVSSECCFPFRSFHWVAVELLFEDYATGGADGAAEDDDGRLF